MSFLRAGLILLALALSLPASAAERVALVVGNDRYAAGQGLRTPVAGASLVADALRKIGFEVIEHHNVTLRELLQSVAEFARLTARADVAVAYYAGHGFQFEERNYLVPVDAEIRSWRDVEFETVSLDSVTTALANAAAGVLLVDASYANPFADRLGPGRGTAARGLARIEPGPNMAVASATAPGIETDEADGAPGDFAVALSERLTTPGIGVEVALGLARRDVASRTGGAQVPAYASTMVGVVELNRGGDNAPEPAVAAAEPPASRGPEAGPGAALEQEMSMWAAIRDSGDPSAFRSFLELHPNSVFAVFARTALEKLQAGGGAGVAEPDIPDFPWPPPLASAMHVLPREFFGDGDGDPTLGGVARRIELALDDGAYFERGYYRAPGGFAMVTRLERMREDGTPEEGARRWSVAGDGEEFSLARYLRNLLVAEPGHYRLISFVVSALPFSASGAAITAGEGESLLSGGLNVMPRPLAEQPFTRDHNATALVYEFVKPGPGAEASLVMPGTLPGRRHLERARLWSAFAGAGATAE